MMKCICCQSDRFITSPFFLPSYFKCKKCGLIFKGILDNQKLHENIMHHYREIDPHDKIAESKASFFHFVLEYITLQFKDKKINLLDVGCGHGYFLEMAAARGIQTYGVEIENDSARSAQSKFGAHRIFNGEFLKAEYPNESFDVITLWDVLVMFEDPLKGLRKCHNILKKGGILGIRVRNVEFQKNIFLIYSLFKKVALRLGIKKPYVFHPYCFNAYALYSGE